MWFVGTVVSNDTVGCIVKGSTIKLQAGVFFFFGMYYSCKRGR